MSVLGRLVRGGEVDEGYSIYQRRRRGREGASFRYFWRLDAARELIVTYWYSIKHIGVAIYAVFLALNCICTLYSCIT